MLLYIRVFMDKDNKTRLILFFVNNRENKIYKRQIHI